MKKKGLNRKEVDEWIALEGMISVSDCFGTYDLKRRAQLERKMNDRQQQILEDYDDALDYDVPIRQALADIAKRLRATTRVRWKK